MCLRDRMESLSQRPHVPPKPEAFYCLIMYRKESSVTKKKVCIILIFKSLIKHRMMETAVNEDAMF